MTDHVMKMGKCREERMSYVFSKHDESALAMFANAGRAYTGDTQVAYAGGVEASGLGAGRSGAPAPGGEAGTTSGCGWGQKPGRLLNATKTRLAAPRLSSRWLRRASAPSTAQRREGQGVREAWAHHPLLGAPMPSLPPAERRIEGQDPDLGRLRLRASRSDGQRKR